MHRQIAGSLTGRVTKWVVVALWLVLAALSGAFGASKLSSVQDNQNSAYLPSQAESTKVLDALAKARNPNEIPSLIVYERKSGLTQADLASLAADAQRFASVDGVTGKVIGPIPSQDGQAAQTVVTVDLGSEGFNKIGGVVDRFRSIATHPGISTHVTGPGGQAAAASDAFSGLDSTLLYAAVIVVVVILLITYRSPVLWILPVLSAGVSLTVAQAVVYVLAKHAGLVVNGQSQGILTVLVFGAGTDYALLLVARYREELRRHEDRHEAMAFALHRASPAVLASAGTVVISMLCLHFASLASTSSLGPVLAVGVVAAVLVMITLLPALLVVTGRWVFWPVRPTFGSDEPSTTGIWAKVGHRVARRPRATWVVTAVLLGACCLGVTSLDTSGLSTADSYTKTFDFTRGDRVLAAHGLADNASPLLVVTPPSDAAKVADRLTGITGLGRAEAPVTAGGATYVSVPLTVDPSTTAAGNAVLRARAKLSGLDGVLVGGDAAIQLDITDAAAHDNRLIIPLVLLVVLLILVVLLRALVAPLLLMATVVLSFGAALGLSTLVFNHVLGFAGSTAIFPLFVFVFLVALGIDYNIFLMTRVREETRERGTREGVLVALRTTGGVITSAGIVLAATFAVLGTLPLVFLAEIGIAVALGVLLDTFVVRSVLVTALGLDLGPRIWWPSSIEPETAGPGGHAGDAGDGDAGKSGGRHRLPVPTVE